MKSVIPHHVNFYFKYSKHIRFFNLCAIKVFK